MSCLLLCIYYVLSLLFTIYSIVGCQFALHRMSVGVAPATSIIMTGSAQGCGAIGEPQVEHVSNSVPHHPVIPRPVRVLIIDWSSWHE